jgi:hypothetical protein
MLPCPSASGVDVLDAGRELPWVTAGRAAPRRRTTRRPCRRSSRRNWRVRAPRLAAARVEPAVRAVSGPVRLGTRWRRSRARNSLQRQVSELAARASRPEVTVWRAQPVVEVCAATHYPAWRKARERAWKRDGNRYSVHSWPERIAEGELAAVLLMQSHGGHRQGQPAEIAIPGFAHGFPPPRARRRASVRTARAGPPGQLDQARTRRSAPRRAARAAAHRPDRAGAQASHPARSRHQLATRAERATHPSSPALRASAVAGQQCAACDRAEGVRLPQ